MKRKTLGIEHEDTLRTMHLLAYTLECLENYKESEECYRETLKLRTKVLGAEHEDTLIAMYNLADTLAKLRKYEEAKEVSEKCLELNLRVYGPGHSETTDAEKRLAFIVSAIETKNAGKEVKAVDPESCTLEVLEPDDVVSIPEVDAVQEWRATLDMEQQHVNITGVVEPRDEDETRLQVLA